jgi:hypothetical protein
VSYLWEDEEREDDGEDLSAGGDHDRRDAAEIGDQSQVGSHAAKGGDRE